MVLSTGRTRLPKILKSIAMYAFLSIIAVIFVFPYLWTVLSTLKEGYEIRSIPLTLFPSNPNWDIYIKIWEVYQFSRSIINSFIVATIGPLLVVATSCLAGYALSKYSFRGGGLLFRFVLGTMMLPWFITLLPRFLIVYRLGWMNTFWALIIPSTVNAYGIFLARQFTMTIPDELIEAAKMDGCTDFGAFWRIVLPLLKPIALVLFMFNFITQWNEFLWPLIVIHKEEMFTSTLLLQLLRDHYQTPNELPILLTGTTICSLPTLLVFSIMEKRMVRSIKITGLKGA